MLRFIIIILYCFEKTWDKIRNYFQDGIVIDFETDQKLILSRMYVTLKWKVKKAYNVFLDGKKVENKGEVEFRLTHTEIYTLTAKRDSTTIKKRHKIIVLPYKEIRPTTISIPNNPFNGKTGLNISKATLLNATEFNKRIDINSGEKLQLEKFIPISSSIEIPLTIHSSKNIYYFKPNYKDWFPILEYIYKKIKKLINK